MKKKKKRPVDELTLSTVWYSLQRICWDMRYVIDRTAQNYFMAALHDLSVGIWDARGRTVSVPVGIASQFLGAPFAVKSMIEIFGKDLHPGDVILTNDPFHGGHNCHLPDWGFFRPIFYKGELLFWTLARGHQLDSGGSYPGGYFSGGYDIHSEGICIPPIKVFERGVEQKEILRLLWNNVRLPEGMKIDNYSMIASTRLCERRLTELMDKYGKETVLQCIEEMIARTERATRREIRTFPEGTYHGESTTDDDGTVYDEPVTVKVQLTVHGDEMTLDLRDNVPQRKGFINSNFATTYANAMASVVLGLDPALADFVNEGTLRPIHVLATPGTVVHAQYPVTVGSSPNSVGVQILEAVLDALAKARPERAIAAAGRNRAHFAFGRDLRTQGQYVRLSFSCCGGLGAVNGFDGYSPAVLMQGRGSINRGSIEEEEVRFPYRIGKYEFAADLMGAGKYRGGLGIDWEEVNEGEGSGLATGCTDGDDTRGHGCLGGEPTPLSRMFIRRGDQEIPVHSHRVVFIERGDTIVKVSAGGGGVGNPRERDPERVLEDVRNEVVSLRAAREVYGVHIETDPLRIDWDQTRALRVPS